MSSFEKKELALGGSEKKSMANMIFGDFFVFLFSIAMLISLCAVLVLNTIPAVFDAGIGGLYLCYIRAQDSSARDLYRSMNISFDNKVTITNYLSDEGSLLETPIVQERFWRLSLDWALPDDDSLVYTNIQFVVLLSSGGASTEQFYYERDSARLYFKKTDPQYGNTQLYFEKV